MKYTNLSKTHKNSLIKLPKLLVVIVAVVYVLNIVGIPFSLASSEIEVRIYSGGDKLVVEVTDKTGKKINEALIYKNNKLFARAYPNDVKTQSSIEQGVVSFIFDDGWLDIYTDAYPVFEKHGKAATIAVITDYVDTKGALSSKQIRRLIDNGWDIAAHSVNDYSLLKFTREEQENNLKNSKDLLWKNFWATQSFVFPYGEFDEELLLLASKHYKTARGYENGINEFPLDPYDLKIISLEHDTKRSDIESVIEKVDTDRGWLIFVGHHVSSENDGEYSLGSENYDHALEYIAGKNLRVLTYEEAVQKLIPDASLIKDGKLYWEIDPDGVKFYDIFYVEVEGKRSRLIHI